MNNNSQEITGKTFKITGTIGPDTTIDTFVIGDNDILAGTEFKNKSLQNFTDNKDKLKELVKEAVKTDFEKFVENYKSDDDDKAGYKNGDKNGTGEVGGGTKKGGSSGGGFFDTPSSTYKYALSNPISRKLFNNGNGNPARNIITNAVSNTLSSVAKGNVRSKRLRSIFKKTSNTRKQKSRSNKKTRSK